MPADSGSTDGLDLKKLSLRDVIVGLQRLSIASVLWLVGVGAAGLAVAWQGGQWWSERGLSAKQAPAVVPIGPVRSVDALPESPEGIALLKDISVFDLRAWVPVPARDLDRRLSPVNYINYLHLKKTGAADKYIIHYATSGYAIDLRCITHEFAVLQREPSPQHTGAKEYALSVDTSREQIGQEFLIVVEGTYWNGFSNPTIEEASTYTDRDISPLGELALIVLFPETKPFTQYTLLAGKSDSDSTVPYRGLHALYADANKHFIYWSIHDRDPDHHYKLQWTW